MIKLILGFGVGLLLLVVWVIFFPDDDEEVKEHQKWIKENWSTCQNSRRTE